MAMSNRPLEADSSFTVRSPQCHARRSLVSSVILISTVCRNLWQGQNLTQVRHGVGGWPGMALSGTAMLCALVTGAASHGRQVREHLALVRQVCLPHIRCARDEFSPPWGSTVRHVAALSLQRRATCGSSCSQCSALRRRTSHCAEQNE